MSDESWTSPGSYTYDVPSDADYISFRIAGGEGGDAEGDWAETTYSGGSGRELRFDMDPSDLPSTLDVYVGGAGESVSNNGSAGSGGYNGGGNGVSGEEVASGGGGGASDIRLSGGGLGDRIAVAGGGGGAGGSAGRVVSSRGADGGDAGTDGSGDDGEDSDYAYGGEGGTLSSGGSGGDGGWEGEGGNGSEGDGGSGGYHSVYFDCGSDSSEGAGGGGGGGVYGGGGGGAHNGSGDTCNHRDGAGGGGGSSMLPVEAYNTSTWRTNSGDGFVVIEAVTSEVSNLQAENVGHSEVELTFDETATDEVEIERDGNVIGSTTTVSFTDDTVDESSEYTYQAFAVTGSSRADSSDTVTVTTGGPPDVVSADAGDREVMLEASEPGGEYDYLRVYRSGGGYDRELIDEVADASSYSYTETGLLEGREYTYEFHGVYHDGESSAAEDSDITHLPAPTLTKFEATGYDEIKAEWTVNSDDHDGFRVESSIDGGSSWIEYADVDSNTVGTTLEGVLHGRKQVGRVFAYTEDTEAATEVSDPTTTDLADPSSVSLTTDSSVQSEITATWDAVLNNGEYRLEYRDDDPDGDHPDWEYVTTVEYDGELEETVDGLVDGEQYSFRIRMETVDVTGDWYDAGPVTLLVPPSGVEVVDTTNFEVTMEWVNESDFRGSNQIYRRRADYDYDGDLGRLVGTVASDDTTFTDETANPGREYDYMVRALTQWTHADSDRTDVAEADATGLETRSVPSEGPYIEIDHPARSAPLIPEVETIQRQPTINGYPRLSFSTPPDERWVDEDLDDAEARAWIDGERQPIDVLEHRDLSPGSTDFEARGGTQLDRRVVENVDIEEALKFAEYVIEEYTDYTPVVDDPDDVVREDVLVQLAETAAELQAAFEEIPDDLPLEYDGDTLRPLQTCWVEDGYEAGNQDAVIDDDGFEGGTAANAGSTVDSFHWTFSNDYTIPEGALVIAVRGRRQESDSLAVVYDVLVDGEQVTDTTLPSGGTNLQWSTISFSSMPELEPGSHSIELDPIDDSDADDNAIDVVAVMDGRFSHGLDNQVHEPNGYLDGPELYPANVKLLLEEINTPLSIVKADLDVTTDDGLGVAELAIGKDGTDDWDIAMETLSHSIEYEELAATFLARVGLGRKRDLDPRDETPRLGYEPQRLESVEMRVDLDETPVVVNYQPDKNAMDVLREVVGDIADGAFEVRPGPDRTEVHVSRIDGRPSDVDPDLIDWSLERNTEDTVDRAIVYAGAESIRRLPFQADVDEWADLPLGDGRIVRGSETVYDATGDEESLERGEDYEIIPNNPDGPPQIKLLTSLQEPRIDCDFKPRGEHEAVDLPDEPSVIIEDAPNLASQQMADIAAFQAVEGSYTDAIIDASITVPVDQIVWNVLDALNVAALPGDQPYQTKDGDSDPASGDYRLGAGRTGQDEIQQLNDETGRLSEKV